MVREKDATGDRLEGRNVVLEALAAGRDLRWIRIDERAKPHPKLDALRKEAARRGITVQSVPRDRLDAISQTGTHNGVIAEAEALAPAPFGPLVQQLMERSVEDARGGVRAPWIVAIAEPPDPDDVGAVLRTADAVGVDAVVLPPADGPLLTAGARRVAMGAAEHLPLARTALPRALREAREAGLRTVLALPGGDHPGYDAVDLTGPICLALADAPSRISPETYDVCDAVVSVVGDPPDRPLPLTSLAAIVLYERERQTRRQR